MSSPAAFGQWQGHGQEIQNIPPPPPPPVNNGGNEDGITVKPMRLKVLYTFDDQNKTNCLARWPDVLQIQTIVMEEGGTIGVIELKTCIQAITQCSPELVNRMGQDYTVYAYDYSEYDNPLVGQGMLSRVLQTASPMPDVPAQQSRQLITGRVCNNIMALFNNGVKETLEVKLRLVPVPTSMQNEYQNTMEKYREANRSAPPTGYDHNEWNSLVQLTPNFGQAPARTTLPPNPHHYHSQPSHQHSHSQPHPISHHQPVSHLNLNTRQHDGRSVEIAKPLQSPSFQEQPPQMNSMQSYLPVNAPSVNPIPQAAAPTLTKGGKVKKPSSRPASRAASKRPRKPKASATPTIGGNTSGYEECTDGDDGPAPKKRAKITKAKEWNQKNPFGTGPDSLRVAASTAGSLRLFRPIAVNQNGQPGGHMQEIPRAPTPIPRLPQNMLHQPGQSGLRRGSFTPDSNDPPSRVNSPYAPMSQQDDIRLSIESAGPSPGRQDTPAESPVETPHEFNSSPPVMRTRPPSMPSSPPCPTSPCLPQMPRTDSGFMSGSMEELFGDDDEEQDPIDDEDTVDMITGPEKVALHQPSVVRTKPVLEIFQPEYPEPVDALPTRIPIPELANPPKDKTRKLIAASKSTRSRGESVVSEDGTQTLPPLKTGNQQVPSGLSMQQPQHSRRLSQDSTGNSSYPYQPGLQVFSVSPHMAMQQQPQNMSQAPAPSPYENVLQQFSNPQQAFSQTSFSKTQQATTPRPQTFSTPPQSLAFIPENLPSQYAFPQPQVFTAASQHPPPCFLPQQPMQCPTLKPQSEDQGRRPSAPTFIAPPPEPRRTMNRTSSMGVLNLPQIPASDPVLPPSSLQRSQTWSEAPHAMTEGPMPFGEEMQQTETGPAPRKDRSWNAKKAAIKQRLEQAIERGEMPPFCCNCGSIDTPTWRKSWSRECQGAPGYYEYSDEPGRVTSIVISTRDIHGIPTSFQLIKKSLSQDDVLTDYKEFTLCNPCGIWMSKYKTQRPPERWENSNIPIVKKVPEKRLPKPRVRGPKNKSVGSEPPVEFNTQAPTDGPSPTDMTTMQQRDASQEPTKRLNAMTSDAASAALRRAIQSSPARWVGTRHSPISLEVDEPSRRLLFPSPRKDGSPKVLGDTLANVVQIPENYNKDHMEAPNKENCPPITFDHEHDEEFLKMFEEEMARPTTPVQKEVPENLFKTPNRPTPRGRGANGSASKSGQKSSGNLLHLTPTRTPRRSPRNHNTEMPRRSPRHIEHNFMSPFTASLNRIMSEDHGQANSSPSRPGMGIDFETLPDLPLSNHNNNFNLEDFFSTDVPMPSSPPRAFQLYEDPISLNNINWDEFNSYNEQDLGAGAPEEEMVIKNEPQDGLEKGRLEHDTAEQERS